MKLVTTPDHYEQTATGSFYDNHLSGLEQMLERLKTYSFLLTFVYNIKLIYISISVTGK